MPPRDTPAAIASKASPPVEVLVIQSDPAGARSVQALLSGTPVGPFHVTWARSCADGVEHLRLAAATPRKGVEIAAVLVDLFALLVEDSEEAEETADGEAVEAGAGDAGEGDAGDDEMMDALERLLDGIENNEPPERSTTSE